VSFNPEGAAIEFHSLRYGPDFSYRWTLNPFWFHPMLGGSEALLETLGTP